MSAPIRVETTHGGAVERIVLDRPKANVLDAEMIAALSEHTLALRGRVGLKLVVVEGEGRHFSFGASVEEHLPDRVAAMLGAFHDLFRRRERLGVPTVALVRGQCLGGGLELALACGRVFALPDARLGCPEVALGVFAPLASALLPWRIGARRATELLLSGEAVSGEEALAIGLVDEVSADPEAALAAWYERTLADKSAVAVRYAWQAVRRPVRRILEEELASLETLYLRGLMTHADPVEGLTAFLARRPPTWSHR